MTLVICGVVLVASVALSWRLAMFLRDCDRREADMQAIADAERIAADEYERIWEF
jgi:hypothetical protein